MAKLQLSYALHTGTANVGRHKTASIASIATNAACILLISLLLMVTENIQINMSAFQSENTFLAFVDDRLSQTAAQHLQTTITSIPGISNIAFITKEEAFEQFISNNTQLSQDYIDPSILRDRYAIRVQSGSSAREIADLVLGIDGIADVRLDDAVSEGFAVIQKSVTLVGGFLTCLLLAVCTIIMTNTVNLTVSSRNNEIQVMKMMGAYDSFIYMPYLFEGLITGLISAILAFSAATAIYLTASELLVNTGAISLIIVLPYAELVEKLFLVTLLLGLLIGWIGSALAVRKCLRRQ